MASRGLSWIEAILNEAGFQILAEFGQAAARQLFDPNDVRCGQAMQQAITDPAASILKHYD